MAIAPFLPPLIPPGAQAAFYQEHPAWRLDRQRYGAAIADLFPPLFTVGSYPWIVFAAQLAGQSVRVRSLLAGLQALPQLPGLQSELPLDSDALRATLATILRAAASERPLVVVLEHVQHAGVAWRMWLSLWLANLADLPVLFVVTVDTAFPLSDTRLQVGEDEWLLWLRRQTAPHSPRAHGLHVGRLTRGEIEELLAPSAGEWAMDLYALSEGAPAILGELLAHWRSEGKAEQGADGRWRLRFDPRRETPGSLTMHLVEGPLRAWTQRAQALGYKQLGEEDLRNWLRLAAWEGEVFSDAVLAQALGYEDDEQIEHVQIVLEAACTGENEVGVLEELDETVQLATADLQKPFRYLGRYRITPPVLRLILKGRQSAEDRRAQGGSYAQALAAVYAAALEQVVQRLIEIYEEIGDHGQAQALQGVYGAHGPLDAERLAILRGMAATPDDKRLLIRMIRTEFDEGYRKRHPHQFVAPLQMARELAQEIEDSGLLGATCADLGFVYDDLGEKQKALACHKEELLLRRKAGDKRHVAATLTNIGGVYSDLGEQQKALAYYAQALPLRRMVGDKGGEANTLGSIGLVYAELGEHQKALAYYEQALPLMREVGDKHNEATTLGSIGGVYANLGEQQKALPYLEQALPLMRMVGDKRGEARTLHSIGVFYANLGEQQKALAYLEQALPLRRMVGDKRGEAATLSNIGLVYAELGEQQKALASYAQALPLLRMVGDKRGEAHTLSSIGGVYANLGEKQKALAYHEQALPLRRIVGDKRGEAVTFTNIGLVYADLGEKQKALASYAQALPLQRMVGDKRGEAATLSNIGVVYADLGEKQKALAYLEQALPLQRMVGDKGGEAATLSNIGVVYADLGEKQKALAYLEQALPLMRMVEDRWHEADVLYQTVHVLHEQGELGRAEAAAAAAVALDEQLGRPQLARDRALLKKIRAHIAGEEGPTAA